MLSRTIWRWPSTSIGRSSAIATLRTRAGARRAIDERARRADSSHDPPPGSPPTHGSLRFPRGFLRGPTVAARDRAPARSVRRLLGALHGAVARFELAAQLAAGLGCVESPSLVACGRDARRDRD